MFAMFKNMLSKMMKIITNKKVLVVLAVLAVIGGCFLFMKSKKALEIQSDVDEEIYIANMVDANMKAMQNETKELSQSPQPMPSVEENLAMIE